MKTPLYTLALSALVTGLLTEMPSYADMKGSSLKKVEATAGESDVLKIDDDTVKRVDQVKPAASQFSVSTAVDRKLGANVPLPAGDLIEKPKVLLLTDRVKELVKEFGGTVVLDKSFGELTRFNKTPQPMGKTTDPYPIEFKLDGVGSKGLDATPVKMDAGKAGGITGASSSLAKPGTTSGKGSGSGTPGGGTYLQSSQSIDMTNLSNIYWAVLGYIGALKQSPRLNQIAQEVDKYLLGPVYGYVEYGGHGIPGILTTKSVSSLLQAYYTDRTSLLTATKKHFPKAYAYVMSDLKKLILPPLKPAVNKSGSVRKGL